MAKKSLGLSLDSVLSDVASIYDDELSNVFTNDLDTVRDININDISPNPYQPRKNFNEDSINELANSIKNHGLLQPVVIIEADELCAKAKENNEIIEKTTKYFLIAGERRLRAIKALGHDKIKAIIANIDIGKTRELALLENIQREDLNPIELALAYKELMRVRGITQEELAQSIQKSRANIANTLRLLTLSKETQQLIIDGKISAGHAKVIAGDKDNERLLVDKIIKEDLNVRDCEEFAKKLKSRENIEELLNIEYIDKLKGLDLSFKLKKSQIIFNLKDQKTVEFIERFIRSL